MSVISLDCALFNKNYQIDRVEIDSESKSKLTNIGVVKFAKISLLYKEDNSIVIHLPSGKFAISAHFLSNIFVTDILNDKENYLSLEQIEVGQTCKVVSVYGKQIFREG